MCVYSCVPNKRLTIPLLIFFKSNDESQAKAKTINARRAFHAWARAFLARNFPRPVYFDPPPATPLTGLFGMRVRVICVCELDV